MAASVRPSLAADPSALVAPSVASPPWPSRATMASPPPRGMPSGAVAAWACLLLGLAAVAWLPAALWPRAGLPAWPAVSVGLVAVLLSWGRGGALLRVAGGLAGLLAAAVGVAQIAVLWATAWGLSYM